MKKKDLIKLIVVLLLLVLLGAFTWYVNDYYHADEMALKVLEEENIVINKDNIILKGSNDIGIIFY